MTVRFDDGLTTVLRWASDPRPAARALVYRQLIDLMAQRRFPKDPVSRDQALRVLRTVRDDVPRAVRLETAQVLGRQRSLPRELAPAFLQDEPEIAAPVLARLSLTDREWRAILPELAPALRAHLCQRQDLPDDIRRLAVMLGSSPLALPAPVSAAPDPIILPEAVAAIVDDIDQLPPLAADTDAIDTSIQVLIDRIEMYREQRQEQPAAAPVAEPDESPAVEAAPASSGPDLDGQLGCDWRWETDRFATLSFVDRPEAGLNARVGTAALIGSCLFSLIEDGPALDAIEDLWRRRVPFRNKPVTLGQAPLAGTWLLSGVPVFESRAGLFLGYRGTAVLPLFAAQAQAAPRSAPEDLAPAEDEDETAEAAPMAAISQLGELAHEVRTPLTAIMGFAQLIEAEVRGPVDPAYQERAAAIVAESRTMLETLDTIAETDKAQRDGAPDAPRPVQPAQLVETCVAEAQGAAAERGVFIVKRIGLSLPDLWTSPDVVIACVSRMLRQQLTLAQSGDSVVVSVLSEGDDGVRFMVRRPVSDEAEADDSMISRLVRLQAHAVGGTFQAETPARWALTVPSLPPVKAEFPPIASAV